MLHIHKELAVQEDIVWGWGIVTQTRDLISGGTGPIDYHKVNAMIVPAKDEQGNQTSDVQTELDLRMTITTANSKFASLNGSPTQTFHVAPATAGTHATPQAQVASQIAAAVSQIHNNYAKRINVLGLDQTTPFTPTTNYQPATKLYVDNKLTAIGAGDMAKAVYDKNDNGIVDNTDALGGIPSKEAFMYRGTGSSLDADNFASMGSWTGQSIANAPDNSETMIANFNSKANGLTIQMAYSQGSNRSSERTFDGTNWSAWSYALGHTDIVNTFAGNGSNPYAVASANTVKQLHTALTKLSGVPIGTITMFSGNLSTLPADWHLCDGGATTPNLNDKFIKGTTDGNKIGTHGGHKNATMPSHTHTANHGHNTHSTSSVGSHHHSIRHDHPVDHTALDGYHNHKTPWGLKTIDLAMGHTPYGLVTAGHSTTDDGGSHTHKYSVEDYVGNSGDAGHHSHTIKIPTASFTTGSAHVSGDNEPPYYVLAYIMKIA